MITSMPSEEMLNDFIAIYNEYKSRLKPNKKTGRQILEYLQDKYVLTQLFEKRALDCINENVLRNKCFAEKLKRGEKPEPMAFFVENEGHGAFLYSEFINDEKEAEIWGGTIKRIFVGVDITTGLYTVEGSTYLHDELCAFCGIDEKDLQNFAVTAMYVESLKRFGMLDAVLNGS